MTTNGRVAPPRLRTWVLACAAAESIGMAASAGAARTASDLSDRGLSHAALFGFGVILVGGLVEGTALGLAQSRALAGWLPGRRRRTWMWVTIAVAGIGWAAGSAPAALNAGPAGTASSPPLLLIAAGAAAMGLVMGAFLGAAQAAVLRGRVRHPWRWVTANALGWAVAMPVIFVGASTPSQTWPMLGVVATGLVTGTVAGTALGFVTGLFQPALDGLSVSSRVILRLLESPARPVVGTGIIALEVTGARSGRQFRFPVMVAPDHGQLVVLPGHAERKTWWRNLERQPEVRVLTGGDWCAGRAQLCDPQDPAWPAARVAYQARWPRVRISPDSGLVLISLRETPALSS